MAALDDFLIRLGVKGIDPGEAQRAAQVGQSVIESELRASIQRQQEAHQLALLANTKEDQRFVKEEIARAKAKTKELATIAKELAADQSAMGKRAQQESAANARATAAVERLKASEIKQALKDEENARRSMAAAAKQADAEIQKIGRAHAAALAENARRDQRVANDFVAAEKRKAREAEIAANKVRNSWRRTAEDLENITVVANGAWGAIRGGLGTLKALSDEIISTSQIFGSLTPDSGGNRGMLTSIFGGPEAIADARSAVEGTVADIDLITAKNRAMLSGLELNSVEFGKLAAAADIFGDAAGTSTKDGLESVVQALASGNERGLKAIGIFLDLESAYEKAALSMGKVDEAGKGMASALSEAEKKDIFKVETFKALDDRLSKSGENVQTFGKTLEQVFTGVKNIWDRTLAQIGNIRLDGMFKGIDQAFTKIHNVRNAAQATDEELEAEVQSGREAAFNAKYGNVGDRSAMDRDAFISLLATPKNKSGGGGPKAALEFSGIERLLEARERALAQIRADDLIDTQKADRLNELIGQLEDAGGIPQGGAEASVVGGSYKFAGGTYTGDEQDAFVAAQGKAQESAARMQSGFDDVTARAGGGLFSRLLFGADGPDETYAQMDEFEKSTVDMAGMLSATGEAMAGALGQSAAAALAGEKSFGEAMKESGKAVLKSLSAQAITEAAMQTARGVAALTSVVTAPKAGLHFAAAAAFGAVGVAAGLGAGMIGSTASSGGAPVTSRAPSSFSGGSSSRGDSAEKPGITININAPLGDPVAIGRAMDQAFVAYRQQTGREIGAR